MTMHSGFGAKANKDKVYINLPTRVKLIAKAGIGGTQKWLSWMK